MANTYILFSEVIAGLAPDEEQWLRDQLQCVAVVEGREVPADVAGAATNPAWIGPRFLKDNKDYDPSWGDIGFQWEFCDGPGRSGGHGRHLWVYTKETGEPSLLAHLVQKFLKRFRPEECWSLSWATTCSAHRVGEFGGGALFVTARQVTWLNTYQFIQQKRARFERAKQRRNSHAHLRD